MQYVKSYWKKIESASTGGFNLISSNDVGNICSTECSLKDGRKLFLVCTYISPGQKRNVIEPFFLKNSLLYSTIWHDLIKENQWNEQEDYSQYPLVICGDFSINFTQPEKNDVKLFLQFFDKYCKLKLINDQKINTTIDEMNERGSTIDGTVARQIHDIQCNVFFKYYSHHKPISTIIPFRDSE